MLLYSFPATLFLATLCYHVLVSQAQSKRVEKLKKRELQNGKGGGGQSSSSSQSKSGRDGNGNGKDKDVIMEWNMIGLQANIMDHSGAEAPGDRLSCTQGPPRAALQLATMHLAMYDAYTSINPIYEAYLTRVPNATSASVTAAVAQAAHDVLLDRYPLLQGFLYEKLTDSLRHAHSGADGKVRGKGRERREESVALGVNVGKQAASAILLERSADKSCVYGEYEYKGESHIPAHQDDPVFDPIQVPISPEFGYTARPFVADNIEQFVQVDPPSVISNDYALAHAQVKTLGAYKGSARTWEDTVMAWFHSYNGSPGIGTPNILLNEVAREISEQEKLTAAENVRLFALLNVALANGGIASWREKFEHNFWRPVVGIRRADEDGNDKTVQDADWTPLGAARSNPYWGECNFTPPFPAYTSGHATFCAAGMKTLINFFGRNDLEFDFVSAEFNGETFDDQGRVRPLLEQTFPTLSVFSSQCAASRIFNGVHWVFDGTAGALEGYDIADYLWENAFRPVGQQTTAYHDVPDVETEIQDILHGNIRPVWKSRVGHVEEVVWKYLEQSPEPATRVQCMH